MRGGETQEEEASPGTSNSGLNNAGPHSKRPKTLQPNYEDGTEVELDNQFVFHNPPISMSVYRDPDTEIERVIIVAGLPFGAVDVSFSLVGNGPGTRAARIDFFWPSIAFDFEALFGKEIEKGMPKIHPKILALKQDLQHARDSIDDIPNGTIELNLPISVQTSEATISRKGKTQKDGSSVLIVELTAYENSYTTGYGKKKIVFEEM